MIKIRRIGNPEQPQEPDWMTELSKSAYSFEDILGRVVDKKLETVQGVVDRYKEMIGLADINNEEDFKKEADDIKSEAESEIVQKIEDDQGLKSDIESMFEHSGGHKDVYSVVKLLRNYFNDDLVTYSDKELVDYIKKIQSQYKKDLPKPDVDAGNLGAQDDLRDNTEAEYYTNSLTHKI